MEVHKISNNVQVNSLLTVLIRKMKIIYKIKKKIIQKNKPQFKIKILKIYPFNLNRKYTILMKKILILKVIAIIVHLMSECKLILKKKKNNSFQLLQQRRKNRWHATVPIKKVLKILIMMSIQI